VISILKNTNPKERSKADLQVLQDATIHIEFFSKLIEQNVLNGTAVHAACCQLMQYVFEPQGSYVFKKGYIGRIYHGRTIGR
jgi:hypothetical protein